MSAASFVCYGCATHELAFDINPIENPLSTSNDTNDCRIQLSMYVLSVRSGLSIANNIISLLLSFFARFKRPTDCVSALAICLALDDTISFTKIIVILVVRFAVDIDSD